MAGTMGADAAALSAWLGTNPAALQTSAVQSGAWLGKLDGWDWIGIAMFVAVVFYFYPSFVAVKTKKKNKDMIFLTNMLLWWTWVVWLICLTVALMDSDED